ncbi:uncharacterized protein sS8_4506 [Methylocaldum marinum]|uniref:Uncharacterized protein n=1 Tax=Methylocaldum marinum TaxID=1432792 RepID=A0A250KY39_9GAMM|nr:VPLPA-CTERM sorting domain-containing protein [Methylocaldum marinum]BBA36436.1 uncharacterized protein sS8_4506 [Methylocaldum marinum]
MTTRPPRSRFGKLLCAYLACLAAASAFLPETAAAATVSGGKLTLNLDRDALAAAIALDATDAPSMYLEEFFDAEASAVRTASQLLEDHLVPGVVEIPATGLEFTVNGPTVNVPFGRRTKPTTMNFDPDDFGGSVNGAIGLSGVSRFRVDTGQEHNRIVSGEYTLEFNAANIDTDTGRSGWTLYNHYSYRSESFNLFNVEMLLDAGTLSLFGDLGLGPGFDHLNGTTHAIVGSFGFQTSVVPVPAAVWLLLSGFAGLGIFGRSRENRA